MRQSHSGVSNQVNSKTEKEPTYVTILHTYIRNNTISEMLGQIKPANLISSSEQPYDPMDSGLL